MNKRWCKTDHAPVQHRYLQARKGGYRNREAREEKARLEKIEC
jgi:hypothetical protein